MTDVRASGFASKKQLQEHLDDLAQESVLDDQDRRLYRLSAALLRSTSIASLSIG